MNVMKRKRELIPRWDMPSDPVKAVFWFLHWSLKVLVRFFYVAVLVGVVWESILNGWIGGVVTLLVGLGVDELSASPSLVPPLKFIIRRLKLTEARALADFALTCESASEILARCQDLARQIAPGLFEDGIG